MKILIPLIVLGGLTGCHSSLGTLMFSPKQHSTLQTERMNDPFLTTEEPYDVPKETVPVLPGPVASANDDRTVRMTETLSPGPDPRKNEIESSSDAESVVSEGQWRAVR